MSKVGRMVKESMVEELSTELAQRRNLFVTMLGPLPATEADVFRKKLSASRARLVVVKQRLGRRAIEGLKVQGLAELLEGSVGLVLPGEDALPAAKLLMDFVKAHDGQVKVRGALIDGQLLDQGRVTELANLPNKPTLLAHVVAMLESPLADVIFTIEQLVGEIAWLAEQAASAKVLAAPPPGGTVAEPPSPQAEGQAGSEPPKEAPAAPRTPASPASDPPRQDSTSGAPG